MTGGVWLIADSASQEADAAEMADQVQELEGDRQHLQVVTQDLDLAEDRVSLHPVSFSVNFCLTCGAWECN